jgi:large subunit ribosomal protein L9
VKVILRQDIPSLGRAGEVKEVKEGYARNYLFPRKLAEELTAGRLQEVRKHSEKATMKQQRERASAAAAAEKLAGVTLTLKARSGDKGRLFGSITAADIALALQQRGIQVDKRKIEMVQPIKALGSHRVTVKLHSQVAPVLDIIVAEEKGE